MGIYCNNSTILGIRILIEEPKNSGDYYVNYEFTGDNWKQDSLDIVSYFIGKNNCKFQTLHPFTTSYNIHTGEERTPGNLWLDNNYIQLKDLY